MVTHNMLRIRKNRSFRLKKYPIVTALGLIKSLIQVKYKRLLLTCALISELPSNICTMILPVYVSSPPTGAPDVISGQLRGSSGKEYLSL